jgi:hypothetical protein
LFLCFSTLSHPQKRSCRSQRERRWSGDEAVRKQQALLSSKGDGQHHSTRTLLLFAVAPKKRSEEKSTPSSSSVFLFSHAVLRSLSVFHLQKEEKMEEKARGKPLRSFSSFSHRCRASVNPLPVYIYIHKCDYWYIYIYKLFSSRIVVTCLQVIHNRKGKEKRKKERQNKQIRCESLLCLLSFVFLVCRRL